MVIAMMFAAALAAGANGPMKSTRYVEIDGARYRVTTKDSEVEVARKSLIVKFDLNERDRQRRAVKAATGCEVFDELPDETAHLRGRLNCQGRRR